MTRTEILIAAVLVMIVVILLVQSASASNSYRITYYGEEFRGGPMACSGEAYDPDDPTVVATAWGEYTCGDSLQVCTSTCLVVTVQDRCGGCGSGQLDLSKAAWEYLGGHDYASVEPLSIYVPNTGNCGCQE